MHPARSNPEKDSSTLRVLSWDREVDGQPFGQLDLEEFTETSRQVSGEIIEVLRGPGEASDLYDPSSEDRPKYEGTRQRRAKTDIRERRIQCQERTEKTGPRERPRPQNSADES